MMRRLLLTVLLLTTLIASLFILPVIQTPLLGTNLFVIALILCMLFGQSTIATVGAVVGGAVSDLLSALPFGSITFSYVATIVIVHWAFRARITNRSFPAYLSLVAMGTILFSISVLLAASLGKFLDSSMVAPELTSAFFVSIVSLLIRSTVIATIVYFLVRAFGRSYATLSEHEF